MTITAPSRGYATTYDPDLGCVVIMIDDSPSPTPPLVPDSPPSTDNRQDMSLGPSASTRSKRPRHTPFIHLPYKTRKRRVIITIDDTPAPLLPDSPPSTGSQQQASLPPSAFTRSKRPLIVPLVRKTCRKKTQGRSKVSDKNGHFIFRARGNLTKRFKMMRLLGQGTFGKVIECYDRSNQTRCAIKVIRSLKKYHDASTTEIRILNNLREHDPFNIHQCIHLSEWFVHEQHVCLVFELMGPSVFEFLKSNHFKPISMSQIQHFARQLFTSVKFIHGLRIVHTDLKPENILLRSRGKSDIRVIDFGSATFEADYHSPIVSTRHYRAPEIILEIGWSYPCDLWSIGCILVEFYTGSPLFQTRDNLEHLAMMQTVLGKFPLSMIQRSRQ